MESLRNLIDHPTTRKMYDHDSEFTYYTCMNKHCIRGIYESALTDSYMPNIIRVNKRVMTVLEEPLFHLLFPGHRLHYKNTLTGRWV
jgi:hypothetical protein